MDSLKTRFDIFESIDNVLSSFISKASEKKLELHTSYSQKLERFYLGDARRFSLVLSLLITIAVKNSQNRHISISVKPVDKNQLYFEIYDIGFLDPLDEDFVKCLEIVQIMNGRLWAESKTNGECSFCFELNLKSTGEEWCSPDFPGKKILIADGNEETLKSLKEQMKHCKIETYCAVNGISAFSLLKEFQPDLILMNWILPDMNGIETFRLIREKLVSEARPVPPAVILVGDFGEESVVRAARQEGIFSLLYKPLNPSVLLDVMMQAFDSDLIFSKRDASKFPVMNGGKMLLAVDDDISRQTITGLLSDSQIVIDEFESTQSIVDEVCSNEYDLIFIDVDTPLWDGYAASDKIRNKKVYTPIVAMGSAVLDKPYREIRERGMNDYLAKPVDVEELYIILLKYIDTEQNSLTSESFKLPVFKSIHIDRGLEQFAGNMGLYEKVLRDFSKDSHILLSGKLSISELRRSIQTLKGLSGNIGALELQMLCNSWLENENKNLLSFIQNKRIDLCTDIEILLKEESDN